MTVKELRDSRKNVSSIYIEFNEIKTRKPLAFISFFEGYDAPYYMPYIKIVTLLDVEQIICGSKQRVIEVHDKFRKKGVLKDCYTGFFVDRDFDFNSDLNPSTDFYVTRGYSVENYYCEKAAFEDILRNHFHYNCIDADYDLIVNNYLTL